MRKRRLVRNLARYDRFLSRFAVCACLLGVGLLGYAALINRTSNSTPSVLGATATSNNSASLATTTSALAQASSSTSLASPSVSQGAAIEPVIIDPTAVATSVQPSTSTPGAARAAGSVAVAIDAPVSSYNPHLVVAGANSNAEVAAALLPSPFRPSTTGEPVVDTSLMTEVTVVSPNPQVVQYRIRPDAVWSDGVAVSCTDFQLDWQARSGRYVEHGADGSVARDASGRLKAAFRTQPVTGYQHVAGILCSPDGRDATVTFDQPQADWKWLFRGLLPAHVILKPLALADLNIPESAIIDRVAALWNSAWNVGSPDAVGPPSAAPLVMGQTQADGSLVMERNPRWWGAPPSTTRVVLRVVPSDQRVAALASGDVQVVSASLDAGQLQQLAEIAPNVEVTATAGFALDRLVFNFRNPVLQQKVVRAAISACVDRTATAAEAARAGGGASSPADSSVLRPGEPGYASNVPAGLPTADSGAAATMLDAAGWRVGNDGIRVKGGQRLSLRLQGDHSDASQSAAGQAMAEQCRSAGIDLSIQPPAERAVATGDFDLALVRFVGEPDVAARVAPFLPDNSANVGRYSNPSVTQFSLQAASELDPETRAAPLNAAESAVWSDFASIPLYRVPDLVTHDRAVKHIVIQPGSPGVLATVATWT